VIVTTFLEVPDPVSVDLRNRSQGEPRELHLRKIDSHLEASATYLEVGEKHYWPIYRISWTDAHWARHLQRPDIEISGIYTNDGVKIGYLEVQIHPDSCIEILNFGLRPAFIGKGYGRQALALAIRRGVELGATSIRLTTCSLDHPAALKNYYSSGFRLMKEEVKNFLPLDNIPQLAEEGLACT